MFIAIYGVALPVSVIFKVLRRNYNAQVALYGIDVQRSPSLVYNHIKCVVDVDADGLSRVITDRDARLINGCGPPPENVSSLGRNVRWRGHSSDDSLSVRSMVGVSHYYYIW